MSLKQKSNLEANKRGEARGPRNTPQTQLDNLVGLFWGNIPYVKDIKKNNELEVRFGTRGIKPLTKIDYDNVIRKLKSLGFTSRNEKGTYMLRINNEFLDSKTGNFKQSQIRTEIVGFTSIQEYCKNNDIKKILQSYSSSTNVNFYKKSPYFHGGEKIPPVNFDDFNFRVSYQTEEKIGVNAGQIKNTIDTWERSKKYFRYINRVTFSHPELPINVDLSITKSSRFDTEKKTAEMTYTTGESGVFENPEIFEIELEVDNSEIGPGTLTANASDLLVALRKTIKYVLMGLQGTNFPISYSEQRGVLNNYMKLIMGSEYDPSKHATAFPKNFIGPSSYTLQMANIAPINERTTIPNIRENYTVTDKADGQRYMLYISEIGKIYLINNGMQVIFTGSVTKNKDIFHSLLDGENILHDKTGKFINLYAAFDIYFLAKRDVRSLGFVPRKPDDVPANFRLILLKSLVRSLNAESIIECERSPITIESKKFYPVNPVEDIFSACSSIIQKEEQGLFKYNTDGLIFTPASMGVGADRIGKVGSLHTSITWEYSFKWKPAQYNTIDFLVKTIKNADGNEVVTPIFQGGMDTSSITQLDEYKTVVLCVGYDPSKHGYINPCQDVLDDKLPEFKDVDNEQDYKPAEFVPTNPSIPDVGICHVMLRKDDSGVNQMFTEEGEVFEDGTIVEFRYDMDKKGAWRWIPLRFRYDKTAKYKLGLTEKPVFDEKTGKYKKKRFSEFGNAYHVANSNWHSIHNPITQEMITTGNNIPLELEDNDIYYNRTNSTNKTVALRDFHNYYVKKLLITSVSRRGDTLIDYACGKAGDFPKWISANLSFVFGIDISKDNLENRIDGACARFLNFRKDFKSVPYALFVNGNSAVNIRSGAAMLNDKAIHITKAVFGEGSRNMVEEKLGKAVIRQYGKGEDGFNVSSCQFALHYFFQNPTTFQNYIRNVAECTKEGGYFIGACYDGKLIYNLLKNKKVGESIELHEDGVKIWEIRKDYDADQFEDDVTSLGYQISVYQESINKIFPEFLVNFDYLKRVMENYGFVLIDRDEAKSLGLPEGSGLFSELFNLMLSESKKNKLKKNPYGSALDMTPAEKKISFLNRYFVYKKLPGKINAERVALDLLDESFEEVRVERRETAEAVKVAKRSVKEAKPRVRKLNSRLILTAATEATDEAAGPGESPIQPEPPVVTLSENKGDVNVTDTKTKQSKQLKKAKKIKLTLEE